MTRRSPLALLILGLLLEAPMHPYEMQRLIKERGKDRVVNVAQRTSLYMTINRLSKDGLITVRETVRGESKPDRTIYQIAESGRRTFTTWLGEMLSDPRADFPEFPAAISYLPLLDFDAAVGFLERRRARLAELVDSIDIELASASTFLPRLMLLEEEHRRAVTAAELSWLTALIEDMHAGRLTWTAELVAQVTAQLSPATPVDSDDPTA